LPVSWGTERADRPITLWFRGTLSGRDRGRASPITVEIGAGPSTRLRAGRATPTPAARPSPLCEGGGRRDRRSSARSARRPRLVGLDVVAAAGRRTADLPDRLVELADPRAERLGVLAEGL
jgi:hypothetical protein